MNKTMRLGGKLGIALCGALVGCTTYGQPSVEVGVSVPLPSVEVALPTVEIRAESDFYEPLAPDGEWVVIGSYGRCWRPGHVARDWRPYSEGYWQRTDAGWYWVSDEPWAWATYHYGRWNFTDEYGWYWVPQIQWAPAWVSWHEGGGYVGWAPMQPPGVTVILPQAYVFVEERHFMEPVRRSTVVVNNTTIINKTVINQGPATTVIETASGRKIAAVPVQELRRKTEAAVVSRQRTPAATSEKKVPTPVRNEAQPAGQKVAPAHETVAPVPKNNQVQSGQQKPVPAAPVFKPGTRPEPAAPAPKNSNAQSETRKSVPAAAESKPAAQTVAKPEVNHSPAIKGPTGQNAGQQSGKQGKAAQPPDKKAQQPAKEQPAASDNNGANPVDKKRGNNPNE